MVHNKLLLTVLENEQIQSSLLSREQCTLAANLAWIHLHLFALTLFLPSGHRSGGVGATCTHVAFLGLLDLCSWVKLQCKSVIGTNSHTKHKKYRNTNLLEKIPCMSHTNINLQKAQKRLLIPIHMNKLKCSQKQIKRVCGYDMGELIL